MALNQINIEVVRNKLARIRQLTCQALTGQIVANTKYKKNHVKTIMVAMQLLKQLHAILHSVVKRMQNLANKTGSVVSCVTVQTFVLHQYERQVL